MSAKIAMCRKLNNIWVVQIGTHIYLKPIVNYNKTGAIRSALVDEKKRNKKA